MAPKGKQTSFSIPRVTREQSRLESEASNNGPESPLQPYTPSHVKYPNPRPDSEDEQGLLGRGFQPTIEEEEDEYHDPQGEPSLEDDGQPSSFKAPQEPSFTSQSGMTQRQKEKAPPEEEQNDFDFLKHMTERQLQEYIIAQHNLMAQRTAKDEAIKEKLAAVNAHRVAQSEAPFTSKDKAARGQTTQTSHLRGARSESPFTSPGTEPARVGKTTKIADPLRLKDNGRTGGPDYKGWKLAIQGKLRFNHDHFPTEEHKMIYVFSMTEGEASKHLRAVYGTGNKDVDLATADEMILYLGEIYGNPNEEMEARREFKKLMMAPGTPFPEFRTKFVQLASEGKISPDNWKEEMYEKITHRLQDAITATRAIIKNTLTFPKMCEYLTTMDSDQRATLAQRQLLRAANPKTTATSAPRVFPFTRTIPASTNLTIKTPVIATKPAEVHAKPIKCYNCFELGHYSRDCPKPKSANLLEIEAALHEMVAQQLGLEETSSPSEEEISKMAIGNLENQSGNESA